MQTFGAELERLISHLDGEVDRLRRQLAEAERDLDAARRTARVFTARADALLPEPAVRPAEPRALAVAAPAHASPEAGSGKPKPAAEQGMPQGRRGSARQGEAAGAPTVGPEAPGLPAGGGAGAARTPVAAIPASAAGRQDLRRPDGRRLKRLSARQLVPGENVLDQLLAALAYAKRALTTGACVNLMLAHRGLQLESRQRAALVSHASALMVYAERKGHVRKAPGSSKNRALWELIAAPRLATGMSQPWREPLVPGTQAEPGSAQIIPWPLEARRDPPDGPGGK